MSNRPGFRADLVTLRDEDLLAASSAGLLRRAAKELVQTTATVHVDGGAVSVDWSDGPRVNFPPHSSLGGASCSCGATLLCRHVLRSILYLRDRWRSPAEPAELAPDTKATSSAHEIDLLALPAAKLEKWVGKAKLNQARRRLSEGLFGERVGDEGREVVFASLGVRVRIPAAGGAYCDCRGPHPCEHALPALLIARGEAPATPVTRAAANDSGDAPARLDRLLLALAKAGLDGLSTGWIEASRGVAVALKKNGAATLAELVNDLADAIDHDARRAGRADPAMLRWLLAAIQLRRVSSDPALERPRADLLGGAGRTVVGLGAAGWWTDELVGLTLYFMDVKSGEILTSGTARPNDRGGSIADFARQIPVVAGHSASELLGAALSVSSSRVSAVGKFAAPPDARVELVSDAVHWPELARRRAITERSQLAALFDERYPSIATLKRPEAVLFQPTAARAPTFSLGRQELVWPMSDASGREMALRLEYRAERRAAIASLATLARKGAPWLVFARLRHAGDSFALEPLTLVFGSPDKSKAYHVDVDATAPRSSRRSASSDDDDFREWVRTELSAASHADDARLATRELVSAFATDCAELAAWLDGVIALGLIALGERQRSQGTALASRLASAGAETLARALRAFIDSTRPPADFAASRAALSRLVLTFVLADEARRIDELAHAPEATRT